MLLKSAVFLAFLVAAISSGIVSVDATVNGQHWTTRRPAQAHAAPR